MKSTDPQPQSHVNSTCKYLGHDWKKTAAANYRLCQRQKCRAAQRLQDGVWVSVLPQRARQQLAMPQQHALF